MIESDISGNINVDCETPMCNATECETHHPECTCDACCQLTGSTCEDIQCDETHQLSGGKKMKNKLMPILANAIVVLAVITNSGLVSKAQEIDRPVDLNDSVVIAQDRLPANVIFDVQDIQTIALLNIAQTIYN